jgi:uncharacterized protein YjbJ (UPF0337 family)
VPQGSTQYLSGKLQQRYNETPERALQEVQFFSRTLE